jgi:hypothetical protein
LGTALDGNDKIWIIIQSPGPKTKKCARGKLRNKIKEGWGIKSKEIF